MKLLVLLKLLAPATIAALCAGCVDYNMPNVVLTDDAIRDGFYCEGLDFLDAPPSAGAWGYQLWAFNRHVATHRYTLSGPGELFWLKRGNGVNALEPVDLSKEYESWGSRFDNSMVYRPPASSDDTPAGGAAVTFACEVLSPVSGMWIRSPDYTFRVARVEEMDFHLTHYGPDGARHVFPSTQEPLVVNVPAGAAQEFYAYTQPFPSDGIQPVFGLTPPEGHSDDPGRLMSEMVERSEAIPPPSSYSLKYEAPEGVASPMDVVAWVSVNDPWAGKRQRLEITFRVSPK